MTRTRRLFFSLVAIDLFLIALHLILGSKFDIFNLDGERNPAAYWSGTKLIAIAAIAAFNGFILRTKIEQLPNFAFAFLFLMLGFDEISELHENITYYLIVYLPASPIFRHPTYNWIIFLSPAILASFIFLSLFVRQMRRESKKITYMMIGGLCLYVVAIMAEFTNGAISIDSSNQALVIFEEASELMATNLFLISAYLLTRKKFLSIYQKIAN